MAVPGAPVTEPDALVVQSSAFSGSLWKSSDGRTTQSKSAAVEQKSTPEQNLPSLQMLSFRMCVTCFCASLHESMVQTLPSSAAGAGLGRQPRLALQISSPLQKTPSEHAALFGVWRIWS